MAGLREWPGSRIAAAWVLWPALLVLLAAGFLAEVVWHARAAEVIGAVRLPASFSDVVVRVEPRGLMPLAVLLLGPPALLTAAWLGQRRRGHGGPPA